MRPWRVVAGSACGGAKGEGELSALNGILTVLAQYHNEAYLQRNRLKYSTRNLP